MSDVTIDALNDLLTLEYRSLPMYLTYASPWRRPEDGRAEATLKHIVTDQQHMAARIVDAIQERNGAIEVGDFPMDFTDMHDLALDFLVKDMIHWQKRDIAQAEAIVAALQGDRAARELAQEVLGAERAHLEALQDLTVPTPAVV